MRNIILVICLIFSFSSNANEMLFKAIQASDYVAVKKILNGDPSVDLDYVDPDSGMTPFLRSCYYADEKIFELMLETDSDFTALTGNGSTCLFFRLEPKYIEKLVALGIDPNHVNHLGNSVLYSKAKRAEYIFEEDIKNPRFMTYEWRRAIELGCSIRGFHSDAISSLIKTGASPDVVGPDNTSTREIFERIMDKRHARKVLKQKKERIKEIVSQNSRNRDSMRIYMKLIREYQKDCVFEVEKLSSLY